MAWWVMVRSFLFIFFFFTLGAAEAKILVISDIDDTVKRSNVINLADAARRLLLDLPPFYDLLHIYQKLSSSQTKFAYISASTSFMYNAQNWVLKKQLPKGEYYQRPNLWTDKREFKRAKIIEFLARYFKHGDTVLFFGDNAELDPEIYLEVAQSLKITGSIFIRDIRMNTSEYAFRADGKKIGRIHYFATGLELLTHPSLLDLKNDLLGKLKILAKQNMLFTSYQINRLSRQLYRCFEHLGCAYERKQKTLKHIAKIHQQILKRVEKI